MPCSIKTEKMTNIAQKAATAHVGVSNIEFPAAPPAIIKINYFSLKHEVVEFSGLRSSGCVTFSKNVKDSSFYDVVAAQLGPKVVGSTPVKGETVAKLKVAINGFGALGGNDTIHAIKR
ncbi:hypothetical protein Leryth_013909 [Lithospermum erythrorhizon]|nr:hypothetical protein Leryth_013909 [Lithospermum erythrorhizon]